MFVNANLSPWLGSLQALVCHFTSVSYERASVSAAVTLRLEFMPASDTLTQREARGLQNIRQNQSPTQPSAVALFVQGQFLWQGSELSLEAGFSVDMSTSRPYKMKVMTGGDKMKSS